MKTYIIDLTSVYNTDELHAAIRDVLPLPDYYGNNLDALHDVLTDIREECRIAFLHTDEADITMPNYMRSLRTMCKDVMEENKKLKIEV